MKRLYRSRKNKVLAGICGGIGEYFEVDPVLVRVIAIVAALFLCVPVLVYVIAIFIIPLEPLAGGETPAPPEKKTIERTPGEIEREKARMEEHVKILGILYIALSALGIIAAAIVYTVLVGSGLITGDHEAIFITRVVGISLSALLVLFSLPGIFAGLGLLKYESWARILAMVLGVTNLINVPIGTFLGIYTIWVLTKKEARELFG